MVSLVPRFHLAPVLRWLASTKVTMAFVCRCTEMALPIKGRCSKLTTWRICGISLAFLYAKIMDMVIKFKTTLLISLTRLFFCPGMGTSADRSSCNTNYYQRGDVLPGLWVDGMDVVAVKLATDFAIDYVLKNGPLVMEVYTYR